MINQKLLICSTVLLTVSLSGCSTISKAGKSARNMASFGGQSSSKNNVAVNEQLIIPPSLRAPVAKTSKSPIAKATVKTNQKRPTTNANISNKNYYVVVGTYKNQPQAFETFIRLSSIGLPGATMESRKTKGGQLLHMVRLGPYQKQESIDKVTNSLTSDGLTQFKVVEN